MDKTSAETAANYAGLAQVGASVVLQDDKKSVIYNLATGTPLTAYQDTQVTVSNVKDTAGKVIESKTFTINAQDTTIPTVKNVVAKGSKTIELEFSEPVKNADVVTNYKVNGVALITTTTATATVNADQTKATITLVNALPVGEHKVVLFSDNTTDIEDYAGYKVPTKEFTVNVTEETAAPSVTSAVANSQTKVTVNFNKAVNVAEATDQAKFYWNTTGTATDNAKKADSIKKVNDSTYELTFTTNPLTTGDVSFFVADVQDYNGNLIAGNVAANKFKSTVTVTADAAPQVTKAEATAEDTIVLTFDKALTATSAQNAVNYTVKNSKGDNVSLIAGATAAVYDNTAKTVTLKLAAKAPGGEYTVIAKGLKSVTNVTVPDYTGTVTVTDKTAPTLVAAPGTYSASASKLVVNFSEAMAVTGANSIVDAANYRVKLSTTATNGAFPGGTTFKAINDNKSVEITLPTGSTFTNTASIDVGFISGSSIKAVADKAGNVLAPTTQNITTVTIAGVNVSTGTLNITTPTTVELTLPAAATALASVTANDFKLAKASSSFGATTGNITVQSATLDATGKKITLTVADADKFTADNTAHLYVETTAANVDTKDQLGLKIVDSVSMQAAANKIAPKLTSAAIVDSTNLRVIFDSKLDNAKMNELAADLIIVQGNKIYTGTDLTVTTEPTGTNSTIVNVKIISGLPLDTAASATVKTVSQDLIDATGANGAPITADTTGVQTIASGLVATDLTFNNYGGVTGAKATGTITVANIAIETATAGNSTGAVVVTDDTALAGLTTSEVGKILTATINGTVYNYTIDNSVTTKNNFLTALNNVLGTNGTASFDSANKLKVESATLGAGSTVAFSGTASTAFVGTETAIAGADGDTITVNEGTANTAVFIPNGSSANLVNTTNRTKVVVGGNDAATATALAAAINPATNVTAATTNVVTITAAANGVAGNTYTLAKSDADNDFTLSGTNLTGGIDTVAAGTLNQVDAGDEITFTFNRNVDPSSIISNWDGTAKAVNNLVSFTTGTNAISFNGANVGTIATAGISATANVDAVITLTTPRTLTVKLTTTPAGPVTLTNGAANPVIYTPNANIKSTTGTLIDASIKVSKVVTP